MNQIITGNIIRNARLECNMTQNQLAEKLGISDKTISKWERGCGAPDISLIPDLCKILSLDVNSLLCGEMKENPFGSGNLKKLNLYICPICGNILFSTESTDISCCGKRLLPLCSSSPDKEHMLSIEHSDGEWYVTSNHEMSRKHYISFIAFLVGDCFVLKKLYPEWNVDTHLPFFSHGKLFWYCTEHGLFEQNI